MSDIRSSIVNLEHHALGLDWAPSERGRFEVLHAFIGPFSLFQRLSSSDFVCAVARQE